MACIFFISDPHFSHQNICKFLRDDGTKLRPFESAEEMDEAMIKNWNEVVRPQDKIYVNGDVCMKDKELEILKRLNGHKRLVRGNHDISDTKVYMKYFEEIYGVRVFDDFILSHFPIHPDSITKRYKTNVHGHIHYNIVKDINGVPDGRYFNICVEHINYTPISLEDMRKQIADWQDKYPPVYKHDYIKGAD